jgi:hypothetical protein
VGRAGAGLPAGLAKDFVSARKVLSNGGVVRDIDY